MIDAIFISQDLTKIVKTNAVYGGIDSTILAVDGADDILLARYNNDVEVAVVMRFIRKKLREEVKTIYLPQIQAVEGRNVI